MNDTTKHNRRPSMAAILISLLLVPVMGFIDTSTGHDFNLSIIYLLPIIIASTYSGRMAGMLMALFSSVTLLYADFHDGHYDLSNTMLVWNAFIVFLFFGGTVYLLSSMTAALRREERLVRHDNMTKLPNSFAFYEAAREELKRSRRYARPLTVAYIDLDNFKRVNDTFGHLAGDELIKLVASNINASVRATDVPARLGGDEFAVMLPETNADGARMVIDRIREKISFSVPASYSVTLSIGVGTFVTPANSVDEMIKIVDSLMYTIKHSGKNAVRYEVIGGGDNFQI